MPDLLKDMLNNELLRKVAPWEKALDLIIPEMKKIGVDWYIHGSTAMALLLAIKKPIERCSNWVMSGGGEIFMEAVISIWLHNKELAPYDMSQHKIINYHGENIYLSSLEMLKQDNEYLGRSERVKLIAERIKENIR